MNAIIEAIQKLLGKFIDSFKTKNPTAFLILGAILLASFEVSNGLLMGVNEAGQPLLDAVAFKTVSWLNKGFVAVLFLLGAHTPKPAQ